MSEKDYTIPRVHIEISGGIASVVYKDKGFELEITDYDTKDEDGNPQEESWESDEEVI